MAALSPWPWTIAHAPPLEHGIAGDMRFRGFILAVPPSAEVKTAFNAHADELSDARIKAAAGKTLRESEAVRAYEEVLGRQARTQKERELLVLQREKLDLERRTALKTLAGNELAQAITKIGVDLADVDARLKGFDDALAGLKDEVAGHKQQAEGLLHQTCVASQHKAMQELQALRDKLLEGLGKAMRPGLTELAAVEHALNRLQNIDAVSAQAKQALDEAVHSQL
jgi:hypothetical protein